MVVFSLLFGAIGVILALVGITYLRAYLRISRTDTTDVAAVDDAIDEVALAGTARPIDEPISARFEDADAVMTEWNVAERRGSGEHTRWATLESGQEADPFLLDDGTGEIVVDPVGAEWVFDEYSETVTDELPPRPIREFLAETGRMPNAEKDSYRKRRYKEKRLDVGEDVYVHGPVTKGSPVDTIHAANDVSIGTERTRDEGMTTRTTIRLTPGILPFVGEPEDTLALGGSSESTLFTVADASASVSQRRYLKRGVLVLLFSLPFVAVPFFTTFAG